MTAVRGALRAAMLLIGACRANDGPAPVPSAVAAAAAPPASPDANLHGAPASARAAAPAPPRDTWPCAVDVDEHQGTYGAYGRAVFDYGKRTTCFLPHDLIALGIYGCPETITRRDTDGTVSTKRVVYDHGGHLVSIDGNILITYVWDGDRLGGVARQQWGEVDRARFVDDGAAVVAVDDHDRVQEVLSLDGGGRITRSDEYLYGMIGGAATITWGGRGPQQVGVDIRGPIRGSATRMFVYDCR
jgi:hypothetical protein